MMVNVSLPKGSAGVCVFALVLRLSAVILSCIFMCMKRYYEGLTLHNGVLFMLNLY